MKKHSLVAIVIALTAGLLSVAGTADAYLIDLVSSTSSYPPGSQIPGYGYNVDFMDAGPYPNFTFHTSISTYDATGTPANGGAGTLGVDITTTAGAQIVTGIYGLGVYQGAGSGDETRINDGDSLTLTFDSAVSLDALTIMFGATDASDGFSLYADGSLIYSNVDIWTAGTQVWPAGWQVDLSGAVGTVFTVVGAPGTTEDYGFLLAGMEVEAVPEAGTLLLLGSGLIGIVIMRKRIPS